MKNILSVLVVLAVIIGAVVLAMKHKPANEDAMVEDAMTDEGMQDDTMEQHNDAMTDGDAMTDDVMSENSDDIIDTNTDTTMTLTPTHKATLTTSAGVIEIDLYGTEVPTVVDNFVQLAQDGFYDGTRFHRVIPSFMIQGGDPLSKDLAMADRWGTGDPGYKFDDEFSDNLSNVRGTISMANSGPDTNGSQFFINVVDNVNLDHNQQPLTSKHAVFGMVTSGIEFADAISEVATTPGNNRPVEDVMLESVVVTAV